VSEHISTFLQAFIPLFVAIDPIGLAAIFLGVGIGVDSATKQRIAWQGTLTGGGVALAFLFLGQNMFAVLGISVSDFQIAGGLILFILAARDLVQPASHPTQLPAGFGVVPLGMPLIAGPALITTLLLLARTIGLLVTLAALVVNLAILAVCLAYSDWLGRKIGGVGLTAISKLISMLLAAIAVAMVRRGLTG
jgi:multiple antibiotic resistance protein